MAARAAEAESIIRFTTISTGTTHFADTDFVYGRALAQTAGTAVIRLADAELLPFQFGDFADTVRTYIDEIKKFATDQRAQIEEQNREIEEGVFTASADPRKKYVPPSKQPVPPHLNFAPLENSIDVLIQSARKYDAARQTASPANARAVNAKLIESERRLSDAAGLPGRPWFRHMIYAPRVLPPAMASRLFRPCGKRSSRSAGRKPMSRSNAWGTS